MTTTIDPLGTPDVVYNRSGANLQEFTVTTGVLISTVIPSGTSYFIVTNNSFNSADGIELPAADVGDTVYVFNVSPSNTLNVHAISGDTIYGYADQTLQATSGAMFIKRNSTDWVSIR